MLTSLVAAIPAAYLCFELVKALLSHSENLSTMSYIVMGLTLIATGTAVLIPVGIFFGGRKTTIEKPSAKPGTGDDLEALDGVKWY